MAETQPNPAKSQTISWRTKPLSVYVTHLVLFSFYDIPDYALIESVCAKCPPLPYFMQAELFALKLLIGPHSLTM